MKNLLYNVCVAYEAGGSWKVEDENAREGRMERGSRSRVLKRGGDGVPGSWGWRGGR